MYSWVYTILCGLLLFNGISLISRKVAVNFKFLGVFYILFAYQMFITHFRVAGTMYLLPHFFKTGSLVGYLYGPIFYFFLKSTIQADFKLSIKNLIHFIPFLLHFIELLPFFMLSAEEKSILYLKNPQTYFMDVDWGYFSQRTHTILKCILIIAYTIFGYFKISPFLKSIIQSEVPQDKIFGLFLKWSTRLLLISAVLILITYSLYWLFPLNFQLLGHYTFFVSAVFGALFLMLFPEITGWSILSFAKERAIELSEINFGQPKKLDDLSAKIYESFTKVMEENFTNPDLDVGKMAQLLFMSERTLYRKIKEIWGISPNEVLLDFRLKKAYEAIQNEPGEMLGNIIKQTGFMTNSYFSRCFKKKYGILPSDFQRECKLKISLNKS
jgi:AraC-like DNA-binding protein